MAKVDLTAQRLRELLHYCPDTGAFTWIGTTNPKHKPGRPAGWREGNIYLRISVESRTYFAHRLAWLHASGEWPTGQIDHIDGDRTNNRWVNLRDISHSMNMQNRREARFDSSTGILGVQFYPKTGRFGASIRVSGKRTFLGRFDTAEEARQAYVRAKRELHPGCAI